MFSDTPLTVDFEELADLNPAIFPTDRSTRLDVRGKKAVLPFLVVPRSGAESVVVMNNGAVDHDIAQGRPVFQRSSWSLEIRRHQIYFCDPGTLGDDRLALAWGQLDRDHWVVYDAVRAVRAISVLLGVTDPGHRTYFGSSAGGFMSLAMLANDPGATAVINNAQFDWTRWMPTGLNPLREARFDNDYPLALRQRHPLRTNVLRLLVKRRRPLRIDYYVNLASKHDREVDHPMFETFVARHPKMTQDVRIITYEDESAGHNPLHRNTTLKILNGEVIDASAL